MAADRGDRLTLVGRRTDRLAAQVNDLKTDFPKVAVEVHAADVVDPQMAAGAVEAHLNRHGGLDVLINVVGRSDRGRIDRLAPDSLHELIDVNVVSALNMMNAAYASLKESGGSIVNIASLAGRVAPPYLGGYAIAKHALVAMTRQYRLEVAGEGVHVGLVCPGPIRRGDVSPRYDIDDPRVPASARRPGGGAALEGLDPAVVAAAVLRCAEARVVEITLPAKVRLLRVVDAIWPRLADRFLERRG